MWPGRITLTGVLEHSGARQAVVAQSVRRYLLWTTDTVEVDGKELALTKTNLGGSRRHGVVPDSRAEPTEAVDRGGIPGLPGLTLLPPARQLSAVD
jgi:hypothetical protein